MTKVKIIDAYGVELLLADGEPKFLPRIGERVCMSAPKSKIFYAPRVVEVFHDFDADEIIIRLEDTSRRKKDPVNAGAV